MIECEEDDRVLEQKRILEEEVKKEEEWRAANPELAQWYNPVYNEWGVHKSYFGKYNYMTETLEESYGEEEEWNLSDYDRDH